MDIVWFLSFVPTMIKNHMVKIVTTWWISPDENNVQKILMGLQKVVHNDYGFGLKLLGCRGVTSMH